MTYIIARSGDAAREVVRKQRIYAADMKRADASRAERDAAIVAALKARVPQSEIMADTGLSRARLAQIRKGTRY